MYFKLNNCFSGRRRRIDAVLEKAGLKSKEEKQKYQTALECSFSGYKIVMARDIDELWVNSYNPEITRAWNGNTDFQICLDFYAIITYITEYYTKDDTGVVKVLVNTLKTTDCESLKEKMKLLMNTWIKNRQMGEAEAVYRLTKEFHFRDSDATCVFVQTSKRSERSKILKNVTGKPEYKHMKKITVEKQKDNEYVEQYDINSKYDRRPKEQLPDLDDLSFSQMAKMYNSHWGNKSKPKEEGSDEEEKEEETELLSALSQQNYETPTVSLSALSQNNYNTTTPSDQTENSSDEESEDENSDDKFFRVMASKWKKGNGPYLPKVFKLKDPYPGEPPYMKLRTKPAVLRFHKYKVEKDTEAYWFSEAILYMPHDNEEDLLNKINQAKSGGQESWDNFVEKINYVKTQVMEYLEDNEEARMMAA